MDDFLYPMHMLRSIGIGDVAISHRDAAGQLFFQETKIIDSPGAKKNALIRFYNGGTGFIISKKKIPIGQRMVKLALVLTAGHVVCDSVTLKPHSQEFYCYLESGGVRSAYLINYFMDDFPYELRSSLTSAFYYLPGDIAILLLEVIKGKIDSYEIATDIIVGKDCFVSGYPKVPKNIKYCLPQLQNLTFDEITNEANRIFCSFDKKVFAEGKIESENNGLIEISCSTTNGMSGSPIISEGKLVGVYTGGPPVPGQRESLKIIHRLSKNENPVEIFREIKDLENLDMHFIDPVFQEIINAPTTTKFGLLSKVMAGEVLTQKEIKEINGLNRLQEKYERFVSAISSNLSNIVYNSVVSFTNKDLFKANVGISINHGAFKQKIIKIIDEFSRCATFTSLDELIVHLKNQ
ncbi:hypothetical protein SteCoe_30995 [Stentor coeruleus]|uniref:Serine protease n=1 Tax=Stentor coeruleus TaxID=5963 RepID=A0A1R2B2F8_9CILI|nr:hypothetical protein SteCoe_30995 [Stentor coeruleus]